ncbi:GldG family protein [Arthrospira platensis]|jgi:ABC-type uncharacterized transport system involved in gliding motility auxiliary subunit|uniref:ABC-type uncharacterized transport system domain-containing protein n=1 Tax=Limnospira platensis NIES-46 TaxID=1236695 RepID=A0A5M3TDB2_LIMPL|nr:Gldg family protein [Arthrospira platensis]AMW29983.1 ABC transporter [Arthrospira platensis YZ]KDR53914.1 hypothetical protein APPUASWS_030505 [Arthrospira platensis str. Paraca]MBD2671222.1 Gldg family protein [Arthrospira platensis FACHB-439]MBD2712184.1 Gldg family protein [Arthrospira platensis FACHB-835]MDF2211962.1 Gldg family protein [Arthrospira platensis NCB002]MDT9184658.1 Gldg family protein [Limnospira sp. PMC 289.06]MDT9296745.1 Gldg family protein [Arthrospira platensis PCC
MKKNRILWQVFKYSFWLGPMIAIAGLSAGFVSGIWQPVPLALIITGVVIIGVWLALKGYWETDLKDKRLKNRRSTQAGTNALVATVSVIVIIASINIIAVRNPVRIDLTENQQFTLAPQTQTIVTNLPEPLKVWVFDPTQNPQTKSLLDRYREKNPALFSYEFIDPQMQPGLAQEFGVRNFGEIHLEAGSRRQLIRREGRQPLTEVTLTNSIEQIFSDRTSQIYFLQGHGQRPLQAGQGGFQQAVDSLKERNFVVEPLNLAQATGIPENANVIVVAGPQQRLFEGEVNALIDFLDNGGGLLLMLDPKTDPGLDNLLDKWGVKLDDRIAIDATGSGRLVGLGLTVPIVREYGDHPITRDFGNNISLFPSARPVETRPVDGITETPIIWTDTQSWAESNLVEGRLEFNPETDREGPLSLGVALTRVLNPQETPTAETTETEETTETPTAETAETTETAETPTAETVETTETAETAETAETEETEETAETAETEETTDTEETTATAQEARLVVFGNSQFATDGWLEQQLNRDIFVNTIVWLSQPDQEVLSIGVKSVTSRRILMTPPLGRLLSWMALVIFPFMGFAVSAFLWWRRR